MRKMGRGTSHLASHLRLLDGSKRGHLHKPTQHAPVCSRILCTPVQQLHKRASCCPLSVVAVKEHPGHHLPAAPSRDPAGKCQQSTVGILLVTHACAKLTGLAQLSATRRLSQPIGGKCLDISGASAVSLDQARTTEPAHAHRPQLPQGGESTRLKL